MLVLISLIGGAGTSGGNLTQALNAGVGLLWMANSSTWKRREEEDKDLLGQLCGVAIFDFLEINTLEHFSGMQIW
ncbi:hypothetical protein U1Q18_029952 [Sarracenia purpurea var. burkii]